MNEIIDLRTRHRKGKDAGQLAMMQLINARQTLELTQDEFAERLSSNLQWKVTADLIEAWEGGVVPPGDVLVAAHMIADTDMSDDVSIAPETEIGVLNGVEAAFTSRSELVANVPIESLLDAASTIEAAGLSLNLICQQYPSKRLVDRINDGTVVQLLFLRPGSNAIANRETEEGFAGGELTALTKLNIGAVRDEVVGALEGLNQTRITVGTYDEMIRFNMIFLDDTVCVFQPYLHGERGIENPSFIIYKTENGGIYKSLRRSYDWLRDRASFND